MSGDVVLSGYNLYDILGIAPNAEPDEVRRAFRSMARALHPDVNGAVDAARRFALVVQAHSILSDPERRRLYDQSRRALPGIGSHNASGSPPGTSARGALRGANVQLERTISLREAAFGANVRIDVTRREVCAICLGACTLDGSATRCPECFGTGATRVRGMECAHCRGSGVLASPPCPNCDGTGRKRGTTSMVVTIPPAVDEGRVLTLKGDGDVGPRNGPRGDLLLSIHIEPDQLLRRSGIDILLDLPITRGEAIAGCTVEVPTLRGPKRLRILPGTRDCALLRIPGAGLRPHGAWHRGDQFVTVRFVEETANRGADPPAV